MTTPSPPAALFRFSRRLTGETQRGLGALLGMSGVTICRLESGAQQLSPQRWEAMLPRFAIGSPGRNEATPVHVLFELAGEHRYRLLVAGDCVGAFTDWTLASRTAALIQEMSEEVTVVAHPVWLDTAHDWLDANDRADRLVILGDRGSAASYIADLVRGTAALAGRDGSIT